MDLHMNGKTVVITGGTAGIGRAVALAFLKEGANVAVFSRREQKVTEFTEEMSAQFGPERILGDVLDVTDAGQMTRFADRVRERFGSLDVWVNNAGVKIDRFFTDYTSDEWEYVMRVNVQGVWEGAKIAASHMKSQRSGVIVNISSFASKIPHAGQSLYAASKAAVSSLTRTMAAELAPFGIRVVGVVPGMIKTDIARENIRQFGDKYVNDIAMRRLGEPEDLADPIVFLCSGAASYITGVDVEISGGKFSVQNSPYPWAEAEKGC
ncbi:MAG: SDR family oxidoreductase [Eubacteriales bacterium]|nr:SDR family oxidoreductase [Eubacteriales bacterium]